MGTMLSILGAIAVVVLLIALFPAFALAGHRLCMRVRVLCRRHLLLRPLTTPFRV